MELGKISLVLGLLLTAINLGKWGYTALTNWYKGKKNKEVVNESVDKHERDISGLNTKIDTIMTMIDTIFEINKIQTRYIIVNACTEAIENGYIEQYQLQSLEDMYSMYTKVLLGNSYVSTLMVKIRKLNIKTGE